MISLFDEDALKEEGVLRLRRIYPRCPVCNEERPYDERKFISVYGMCQRCDERIRPAIWRKMTTGPKGKYFRPKEGA